MKERPLAPLVLTSILFAFIVLGAVGCSAMTSVAPTRETPLSPRGFFSMTYDADTSRVILYGGQSRAGTFEDTWAFDSATGTWTDLHPTMNAWMDFGDHRPMVYDSNSKRVLMFEGWNGCLDAWAYDPAANTWTKFYPSETGSGPSWDNAGGYSTNTPPNRWGKTMVYEPVLQKVVLFGGGTAGSEDVEAKFYADMWALDLSAKTWDMLQRPDEPGVTAPPGRLWHSMVFDSKSGTMLVFGGEGENGCLDDLWVYDPAERTWIQLAVSGADPPPREDTAMAYDSANNKVVVFGGYDGDDPLGDTWIYDPASDGWTEITGSQAPEARQGHQMVYDSAAQKVILFGGKGKRGYLGDTWAFDTATQSWQKLEPRYVQ
jgi:N-acetylneuraminic acid mutarotase